MIPCTTTGLVGVRRAEVLHEVEELEERGRARYYGYDTIVFQNPGKSEEELIEIWKRAVAAAPSNIERDGQVSYDHNVAKY